MCPCSAHGCRTGSVTKATECSICSTKTTCTSLAWISSASGRFGMHARNIISWTQSWKTFTERKTVLQSTTTALNIFRTNSMAHSSNSCKTAVPTENAFSPRTEAATASTHVQQQQGACRGSKKFKAFVIFPRCRGGEAFASLFACTHVLQTLLWAGRIGTAFNRVQCHSIVYGTFFAGVNFVCQQGRLCQHLHKTCVG